METIRSCQNVMKKNSYFPYLIEVLTDAGVFEAPGEPDIIQTKVPLDYVSPNHSQFKARALHYATHSSVIPSDAWIVHLDEETQPTASAIKGICKFVTGAERRGDTKRIGQGCILYHRSWRQFKFLTLADMRRTGDDFGHFFLQHRLGWVMFGLHGSFVVCRNDTEQDVGFDVGPEGSITEDAWWAFLAMNKGCRFEWVHGFLAEQSTQSMSDLLKQRRRWNYGLMKVARFNPAPRKYRLAFTLFMGSWFIAPFIAPFQFAYVIAVVTHQLPVHMFVRACTLFIIALQIWTYLIGWVVNIREGMEVRRRHIPGWTLAIIVLYPVFQVIELVALLSSFFAGWSKEGRGFHVVQKSASTDNKYEKEEGDIMV